MKNNQMNSYLILGLFICSIVLFFNRFIGLPEIISGFGLGIGIALELIGVYSMKHDITKIKKFKKSLIRKIVQ